MMKKSAPILYQLSEAIVDGKRNYDEATMHNGARVVADTLGTAYGGVLTDAFKRALTSKDKLFGKGNYGIIGTQDTTSIGGAIFFSTLAISSTDYDEGHRMAVGHPASMIVPAAIIIGDDIKASKTEIIKAVIIGYDIATRFSNARIKEKITTYSSGRWGAIGTAATVSYLLKLNIEQTMHALSNAAILSPTMLGGSTDVSTGSMSKEGAAWAAQSGLQSTLFAKDDFVGPYLFVDYHDDYDKKILVKDLGTTWLINSNYFKPYACCRWLHSAIAAMMGIKKDYKLNVDEIDSIEVSVFSRAIDLIGSRYPQNVVQAQFHLPYCVAIGLLFGDVSPDRFTNDNLKNKAVLRLIDKVVVKSDDGFNKLFPSKLPSKVKVANFNGSVLSKEIISAPWDADNKATDEELFDKLVGQAGDEGVKLWNRFVRGSD
ncbi:MAG: MmgE/PrpD family protein [Bacteroidota bacterium]